MLAQPKYANGDFATASVVDQATTIVLTSWNGTQYKADELVTGATSGATGRVLTLLETIHFDYQTLFQQEIQPLQDTMVFMDTLQTVKLLQLIQLEQVGLEHQPQQMVLEQLLVET